MKTSTKGKSKKEPDKDGSFLKVVGLSSVFLFCVLAILLLIVRFGSCTAAAFVADLAPAKLSIGSAEYSHDDLVRMILRLRETDCQPKVTGTVFRFCNDHPLGKLRLYEEAMLLETRIRTYDRRRIDELTFHVIPGVVSGPPDGGYQEVMQAQSFRAGVPTSTGDIGRWKIDFVSEEPLYATSDSRVMTVPIFYYALVVRTDSGITCKQTSESTEVSYEMESGAWKTGDRVQMSTVIESWNQMVQPRERQQYFTEKRNTAMKGVEVRKKDEAARHVHTGWSDFPADYPDKNVDYGTERFDFCSDAGIKCD